MAPLESSSLVDEHSVFINVPFDNDYSSLFIALIAGLTALGRTPRCVLEVPSDGRNRLERIFGLIASCGASIHDLSRVTLSGDLNVPRFNMPFELGMAYALCELRSHSFFVLEEKPFRLQASLSDLNGHDPHIHMGAPPGILRCLLDCFGASASAPPLSSLESLNRRLAQTTLRIQRTQRTDGLFHPHLFREIAGAAVRIARAQGLIR